MTLLDRNEKILALWREGYPSTHIASRVGITRNAVMGVVHRAQRDGYAIKRAILPKPEPEKVIRMPKKAPLTAVTPPPAKKETPLDKDGLAAQKVMVEAPKKKTGPKTIMQLGAFDCRWILPTGKYCGEEAKSHKTPWCEEHYKLVYVPRTKGPMSKASNLRF